MGFHSIFVPFTCQYRQGSTRVNRSFSRDVKFFILIRHKRRHIYICLQFYSSIACFVLACLAGRRKGGREVKMSAGGRRYGLQGRCCFRCFFRPPDERKNPDWSDLMNYLVYPSDWSATCHSKPLRSSQQGGQITRSFRFIMS